MSGGGVHSCVFYDVICVENIFAAWREFRKGKRSKKDVAAFELDLEDNLFNLHQDLSNSTWKPEPYIPFYIQDPKLRKIHKASVRDRVFYQAVYRRLYHIFDPSFINDSYSSRKGKGTHAGFDRLEEFGGKVSANHTKSIFALKCDVRKFFDSIDHDILFNLLSRKVNDRKLLDILYLIIDSFHHSKGKGLPLGNVTSQIFANIYLNGLDQFAKHNLKAKYYIRYCDDFVIVHSSIDFLEKSVSVLHDFLKDELCLELHPNKIVLRKLRQGIDFLGLVSLPHYRVLRTRTKKRMLRKIDKTNRIFQAGQISKFEFKQIISSYQGTLTHCKGRKIEQKIESILKS
jgi:retron-type reverse transcriptase